MKSPKQLVHYSNASHTITAAYNMLTAAHIYVNIKIQMYAAFIQLSIPSIIYMKTYIADIDKVLLHSGMQQNNQSNSTSTLKERYVLSAIL